MSEALLEDIFDVKDTDPDGHRFAGVVRIFAHSETFKLDLVLDVNSKVYNIGSGEKFRLYMSSSLKSESYGEFDTDYIKREPESYYDAQAIDSSVRVKQFEYVTFGRVFRIEPREEKNDQTQAEEANALRNNLTSKGGNKSDGDRTSKIERIENNRDSDDDSDDDDEDEDFHYADDDDDDDDFDDDDDLDDLDDGLDNDDDIEYDMEDDSEAAAKWRLRRRLKTVKKKKNKIKNEQIRTAKAEKSVHMLFDYEQNQGQKLYVHISFGGLLMRLFGESANLKSFYVDQQVYLFIKRIAY
ncbi:hypothetical protein SNEBB_009836 [Seison nebaliae]|nr:hypothetical protein SNEBB_009836 [Seison nebaliae]